MDRVEAGSNPARVHESPPAVTWRLAMTWRLGVLLLVMAGLFAFDILVPSVVVLPFVCVPVVVAAAWVPARVVAWLAGLSVLMAMVSGWSNDYFTSLNDVLWMLAMVTVGLVAVLVARAREMVQAQREASGRLLAATLDAEFDPHVVLEAVRDESGQVVDFRYVEANPAACAYNDVPREQLIGARLLDLLPGHVGSGLLESYREVVETGTPLVLDDFAYQQELLGGQRRRYDVRGVKVGDAISYTWRDVTDRYEDALALRRSREQYRLLAENSTDVVSLVGRDGLVQWVAPSIAQSLGWSADELAGSSILKLVHPDDRPNISRVWDSMLSGHAVGNRPAGFVCRFLAKDGSWAWMSVRTTSVRDASGVVTGIVNGMRVVTELIEAREQSDATRLHLEAVLDSMLDPHVLLRAIRDDGGRIVDFEYAMCNDAACEYMHLDRERLQGARVLDLLPGQAGSGMLALYAGAVESGEPLALDDYAYPHEIVGSERRYDIRAVKVGDALSFTWRDVTERHEATVRLAESEERYRLLAENSSDVVLRTRDEVVAWVSPSLAAVLGWQPGDWLGHRLEEFVNAADLRAIDQARSRMQSGGAAVLRVRVKDASGASHWVEVHSQVYRDAAGRPDGYQSSFRVVDKEVQSEVELARRAAYDDLTGALKRDPALQRLRDIGKHPRTPSSQTAVLFVDVDDFKHVNDTLGHAAGDALLGRIGQVMHDSVRSGDTIARMGGDEFLIILPGLHNLDEATAIAEKIHAACAQPVTLRQGNATATVSIGVALSDPGEGSEDLVARADHAMYTAKRGGGNQVVAVPSDTTHAA